MISSVLTPSVPQQALALDVRPEFSLWLGVGSGVSMRITPSNRDWSGWAPAIEIPDGLPTLLGVAGTSRRRRFPLVIPAPAVAGELKIGTGASTAGRWQRIACVPARSWAYRSWTPWWYAANVLQLAFAHAGWALPQFAHEVREVVHSFVWCASAQRPHRGLFPQEDWECPHWLQLKHCTTFAPWWYRFASWNSCWMTSPVRTTSYCRACEGRLIISVDLVLPALRRFVISLSLWSQATLLIRSWGRIFLLASTSSRMRRELSAFFPLATVKELRTPGISTG